MSETKKNWIVLALMLYVAYVFMMWKWGHQGDMAYWMNWSKYIYNNGFSKIYDSDCNYLPAYLYFLYFHTKVQGNFTDIQDNLYTIKYYTLVFDMLGAFAAVWFVKDDFKKIFYFLALLFNVAFVYNTVMWGQVDAIFTFFGFASIIAALERKTVLSMLLLLLALNFKLQALVFIPIVGLILLPQVFSKGGLRKMIYAIGAGIFLQCMILLPFLIDGRLHQVAHVITGSVGRYAFPTVGAFNLWFWLVPKDIEGMYQITDTDTFFILSYKMIGSILFFFAVFVAVFPLIRHLYVKYIRYQVSLFPLEKIFLMSSLIPLVFFYFNTEMHDRYSHPALISLAAYAFCTKRFSPLILGSVAYFLNMEKILRYLDLRNYGTLIFEPKFVAVLFFILIVYLYYLLYTKPTEGILYTQPEI